MTKTTILLSLLILGGCEGHYRYPCQDPANIGTEECEPPKCEEGTCTKDLIPGNVSSEGHSETVVTEDKCISVEGD